ncbi:MAG: TonB family protein [Pyrinomonadaceae bacterium]
MFLFAGFAGAQEISINYLFQLEPARITEAPELYGSPQINFPDAARKNGVEGTLKAYFTIEADGSIKDIVITESLPHGVDEAVRNGLRFLRFKPAKLVDDAVAVKMYFNYVVAAVYDERDKTVSKPKITSQPDPIYPPEHLAEKLKGEVMVKVLCNADGSVKVLGVNSVMPKEFDRAAAAAAENIEFEPAVHKKSKKAVSQEFTLVYKFKP